MRVCIKASFPVEAGNRAVADGSLGKTIQSILADLKPEAAYFMDDGGQRTAFVFCDMRETSQIPTMAEPWFLALNAKVEIHPAMNADDLAKAAPDFERMIRKYAAKTMTA